MYPFHMKNMKLYLFIFMSKNLLQETLDKSVHQSEKRYLTTHIRIHSLPLSIKSSVKHIGTAHVVKT